MMDSQVHTAVGAIMAWMVLWWSWLCLATACCQSSIANYTVTKMYPAFLQSLNHFKLVLELNELGALSRLQKILI